MAASNIHIPTIYGDGAPLAYIPDDVTIPQFFFDQHHPLGGEQPAYFIEDATGRPVTADEVSPRPRSRSTARMRA